MIKKQEALKNICIQVIVVLEILSTISYIAWDCLNSAKNYYELCQQCVNVCSPFITFTFQHWRRVIFWPSAIVNIWSPTSIYAQFGKPRTFSDIFFLGPRVLEWLPDFAEISSASGWSATRPPALPPLILLSPSGDLGIGTVWHNLSPPPQLFGPTVEILFKLN